MTLDDVDELAGYEFEWFALDADEHVAVFSTFGGGLVPQEALRRHRAHTDAFDVASKLPERTGIRLAPKVSPAEHDFHQVLARRGLFSFEASPVGGPYELLAAPLHPLTAEQLPMDLVALAREIRFVGGCWRTYAVVSDEMIFRRVLR